ncbi:MAG: 7-cyano-7-deazaguanine synthase QueC [Kiritimatiellales bacterium]|nr:7-cyano-7-deazaguanine synthase QueC [Kiritimatiellales bacterium]
MDVQQKKKAVVLLSGGLDSATAMAMAQAEGFEIHAMSFNYGQRHAVELECAAEQAAQMAVEHRVVEIDLRAFGGSALTDDIDVPKHEDVEELSSDIPVTYVPARNTVFLSYALAWAEVLHANDIFVGVNALDYSGYPDCRPEFIAAFEAVANLATVAGVSGHKLTVHAPLIDLSKAEIIKRGLDLGVDYAKTTSCYDPAPDGRACGHCDSCLLRKKGFREIGEVDPRGYV